MKRTKKLLSFFLAIMMVITTIPAFTLTASAATINETAYNNAINAYVSKMNDSDVYNNMQTAYNAYIALKQSYDLCKYGGSNTMTADTVNSNIRTLNNAVNNMTRWTGYNSFFKPATTAQLFVGDAADTRGIYGTDYKKYYNNTLYVAGSAGDQDILSTTENSTTVVWNMPYAVGLYTGTQIEVPVMTGIYNSISGTASKYTYMFTNFFDASKYSGKTTSNYNGQITYKDHWRYRSGCGTKHFSWATETDNTNGYAAGRVYDSPYRDFSSDGGGGTNGVRWAYNAVVIKPNDDFTNNYKEFTTLNLFSRVSNNRNNSSNWQAGQLLYKNDAPVGYYIIDYRPVTNNLTSAKTKIKNDGIANFDANNSAMSSYMEAVDNLIKIDTTIANTFPLSASNVSKADCQTKAKYVGNAIKTKVSELDTEYKRTTANSAKTTAYNDLRTAMDNAMANYQKGEAELKKTYTANSVDAFIDAYNNAKLIMSKVGPYDDNYGHDANDTNAKATDLSNAYLVAKANFSEFNRALSAAESNDYLGKHTTKTSIYGLPTLTSIQSYNDVTFYDQDNTPVTKQSDVDTSRLNLANANLNIYNNTMDQSALVAVDENLQAVDVDINNQKKVNEIKKTIDGLFVSYTFNQKDYWAIDVKDQRDLDSKTRSYINEYNSSLNEYTITVNGDASVIVGGNTVTPTSSAGDVSTYTLTYGVPITFKSNSANYASDTAWYMSYVSNVAGRGEQYQCSGEIYTTKVMGNMTVTAKAKSDETPNKVTVVRQYSNGNNTAMLIDYVNGSFTLPTAQTYPNYTFTGYEVKGTAYNAGDEVSINANTVIYAKYDAIGSDCAITITKTDGTTTTENYKYNSVVNLSDSNAYAWIVQPVGSTKWTPAYIGTDCPYRVTEAVSLKAVATEAEMKQYCEDKEAYEPNLRFNGPLVAAGKGVVFHGQFIDYVPSGAEIVEYGVVVNVNNANDFDLINTNGTIIRCKSTNPQKSNQFSVGALYKGDFTNKKTISYRSYMIYKVTLKNGMVVSKYAYSDVLHFNPNA